MVCTAAITAGGAVEVQRSSRHTPRQAPAARTRRRAARAAAPGRAPRDARRSAPRPPIAPRTRRACPPGRSGPVRRRARDAGRDAVRRRAPARGRGDAAPDATAAPVPDGGLRQDRRPPAPVRAGRTAAAPGGARARGRRATVAGGGDARAGRHAAPVTTDPAPPARQSATAATAPEAAPSDGRATDVPLAERRRGARRLRRHRAAGGHGAGGTRRAAERGEPATLAASSTLPGDARPRGAAGPPRAARSGLSAWSRPLDGARPGAGRLPHVDLRRRARRGAGRAAALPGDDLEVAVAGLPLGGGKGVVMLPAGEPLLDARPPARRAARLRRHGGLARRPLRDRRGRRHVRAATWR